LRRLWIITGKKGRRPGLAGSKTTQGEVGLARAGAIYRERSQRVRQLRTQGEKILGYICAYPPLEMMTALDIIPYRILGDITEPITRADACMPTAVCPFLRSALDLGLKDRYDFLDGVVMAHSCDTVEKTAHIWHSFLNPPYFHFIDTPHTASDASLEQQKQLLKWFQKTLEALTQKELSPDKLKQAIKSHNRQRALVRELYGLRKADPPLISGAENLRVMVALMSLPVAEGSTLLEQVISEVKQRADGPQKKPARLMVWGSILDSTTFIEAIEQLEANLVMDDICVGSRFYWPDVELTADPLDGLAHRYLVAIKCPRTFPRAAGEATKSYQQDLETRFGYLGEYITEWGVDGVILQAMRYCDIHGYDVPQVRDYLKHIGVPSLYIEYDYSQATAQMGTRVQAFLEMIG
jgi:benzoyl-CoA reductase/2-hydroxyglutaryl-CoA dehydratase subunit BcrC/BadD/HgdB